MRNSLRGCARSARARGFGAKEVNARRALHLEYEFDRLLAAKLELVYDILVPDRARIISNAKVTGAGDEDRGDLRSCIVGQALIEE